MKRLFLSLGLFAIALTSISATSVKKSTGCNIRYRYIERFLCGDVLQGEYIVWPEGGTGPGDCTETVDFITEQSNPMPVCWHMHPPGGRY